MTFAEEMPTDPKSIKQRAIDIIANAEDEIGQQELLLALHQQLSLEDSIELGRSLRDHQASAPKSSWIGNLQDAAGCLVVPLVFVVIFAAMPFLFSIGERFLKSPARSVAEGVIPKDQCEDLVIVCGVFIHPEAQDNQKIYQFNKEATKMAIVNAMKNSPSADEMIAGQANANHPFKGF